jgi:long-subunit acyl-CoA synthetase (AMP-forming)
LRYRSTCSILGWDPREKSFSASVGELNANCEAKIVADDGVTEILERNQRGELWVRAQNVMKGYWHNPKATKETKTEDGWLRTGDIAYVDDKGKFHVVDRMKVSSDTKQCPLVKHRSLYPMLKSIHCRN